MLYRSPKWEGRSFGPQVAAWMETNLVYGPGDLQGRPYQLADFQHEILWDLFAIDDNNRRVVRRGLIGLPKGSAKTELVGGLGAAALDGPSIVAPNGELLRRVDPDIVMGAASYDQADLVYGAASVMSEPIWDRIDGPYDREMGLVDRRGRLQRIAAKAGTNDGLRPTEFFADEIHEWDGAKERVHLVVGNGLSKRDQSLELSITTAGHDLETLAGRLFAYGLQVASGEVVDPSFLFFWHTAPETDLDDPEALRSALREANPAPWIDVERIAKRYEVDGIAPHEFRRYYLNQWTAAATQFLPFGVWAALEAPRKKIDVPVVLAFDGSYAGDCTALYGVTVEDVPYVFRIGLWENPGNVKGWQVPRGEVDKAVHDSFATYDVWKMLADPFGWGSEIEGWKDTFGERDGEPLVEEFWTNQRQRMARACSKFYTAVTSQGLTHDGDQGLARHLENCATKETQDGVYIVKDGPSSPRKIDAAVAAVVGVSEAFRLRFEEGEKVVEPSALWA